MAAIFRQIDSMRKSGVLGQLIRFGISGGIATAVFAAVYSPLAKYGITTPFVANLIGYVFAVLTGYVLHSGWSFRGHGERGNLTKTGSRFVAVSLVSLGLNSLFVFLLTDHRFFGGAWWWPLIPIVFVTPLITFALQRVWVFGK